MEGRRQGRALSRQWWRRRAQPGDGGAASGPGVGLGGNGIGAHLRDEGEVEGG